MKSSLAGPKYRPLSLTTELAELSNELLLQCRTCSDNVKIIKELRTRLESLPRESRRDVVNRMRDGCSPLFMACKRGNVLITEYLIRVCDADVEQKGMFEVTEDNSVHWVTPLWCAAVSGQLAIVKCLIRLGSALNAPSDTGSTPVRSACFMTHMEVVECLVENGADIKKANFNGGTCLINSVQSVPLCLFLISKGADVNARDIQDKTALHYAIQEHRLVTTQLLLKHGADPFAKSRYGDDALQTACLKGSHQIFDYLKENVAYSSERLANAHELIGSSFLDEHNETRVAILHWRLAHHLRQSEASYIPKLPAIDRKEYGNTKEFETSEELDNIELDVDAMRVQSLLICERVLGPSHKDTLFRLMFRGAAFADSLRFQRCIDLWRLALKIRVDRYSILYSDTCFTGQALVRLLLDLHDRSADTSFPNEAAMNQQEDHLDFEDVFKVFELLTDNILEARRLLDIYPVYKKQQDNFDRVLKCVTHVILILLGVVQTDEHLDRLKQRVRRLIRGRLRSACSGDTMIHLSVSRLNVIKSGYFADDIAGKVVFPNINVAQLFLECGADVNELNEARSTPLHIAAAPYNYDAELVTMLLENGAHMDQPNKNDNRPITLISMNPQNSIPLVKYTTLKCLAATVISKYKIPYRKQVPQEMEQLIRLHQC